VNKDVMPRESILVGKDFLLNQVRFADLRNAERFDKVFEKDLLAISEEHARLETVLLGGFDALRQSPVYVSECCAALLILSNASQSIVAAVQLLRHGYLLQAGVLLRTVAEGISTAIFIHNQPKCFNNLQNGKLGSQQTLGKAKRFIPQLGQLYGMLSSEFAHIGKPHRSPQPLPPHEDTNETWRLFLSLTRFTLNTCYVAAEAIAFKTVAKPRYWHRVAVGELKFDPSQEEQEWQRKFCGFDQVGTVESKKGEVDC
jgi:hypothetical protein